MTNISDLYSMDLDEARALLADKGFDPEMQSNDLAALARSMPKSELVKFQRALMTAGTADLMTATRMVSASATVQRILNI